MKNNALKKLSIILLILIISLISFIGIYVPNLNRMKNVMPEYKVGMDFGEIREIRLDVSSATETKYYDAEGKEVDEPSEETEEITSKVIETNPQEILTAENFAKVKAILTKRLEIMGVKEYNFRQDENGYIAIQMPADDDLVEYKEILSQIGKLEVVDDETKEVLLDSSMIKEVFPTTHSDTDGSTVALVVVNYNDEGKAKLDEISKIYVKTTDEEGNETTKGISIVFDGQTLMRTYFGSEGTTKGQLPISIGRETTDRETIVENYKEAVLIANVLRSGTLPITYNLTYENISSSILRQEVIQIFAIAVAVLLVIAVAYLIIRYNGGIFAGISWLGFIAFYLLILRFTNSIITMNSIIAIMIVCVFNYIFLVSMLSNKENKSFVEVLKRYIILGIPMFIIALVLTFASMTPVSSFAIALFWGCALMIAYNYIITKNLYDAK